MPGLNGTLKLNFARLMKSIADFEGSVCGFIKDALPFKRSGKGIRTILINRSDRIGDAFISMPFFIALGERYDITLLTSEYNDEVL